MIRTEGTLWKYPRFPEQSIQSKLDTLHELDWQLGKDPKMQGISEEYLSYFVRKLQYAIAYKSVNSSYPRVVKPKSKKQRSQNVTDLDSLIKSFGD